MRFRSKQARRARADWPALRPAPDRTVTLKSPREIEAIYAASQVVAHVIAALREAIQPGMLTRDLDQLASDLRQTQADLVRLGDDLGQADALLAQRLTEHLARAEDRREALAEHLRSLARWLQVTQERWWRSLEQHQRELNELLARLQSPDHAR
mgnify:CR=1 FL=1